MTNITYLVNETQRGNHTESGQHRIYVSIFLIWLPGIILNAIALCFIIKDIRKAIFPATVLLLTLCCYDLLSVLFTVAQHIVAMYIEMTNAMCGIITFLFTYFKMSSGVINSLMAIDRVIAICTPFYYKLHFSVKTWKIGCFVAGIATSIYSTFPLIGLGDIWIYRGPMKICSPGGQQSEPIKRVYMVLFGIFGMIFEGTLIVCNMILIKALLKMKNTVTFNIQSLNSSDETKNKQVSPFEVAFAKLMICLTIAYLICGTPSKILFILDILEVRFDVNFLHVSRYLGGLLQVIDPMIYILVRKADRKKILECLCRCKKPHDEQ